MSSPRIVRCAAWGAGWWRRLAHAVRPAGIGAGLAIILLFEPVVVAQLAVPPDRQVLILTRALSYDSELKDRVGADLLVGVLSKPGNAASEAMGAAMLKAFRTILNIKVQGLTLAVRPISYTNPAALAATVIAQSVDALYVCIGLEGELAAIIDVSRKRHLTTMASSEAQVEKGLSLGVFPVDSRPSIVLNLAAARSEGAAFSSELLRVAKVLR
jgi:hypothetical protein